MQFANLNPYVSQPGQFSILYFSWILMIARVIW
jgi:hypothetical protein